MTVCLIISGAALAALLVVHTRRWGLAGCSHAAGELVLLVLCCCSTMAASTAELLRMVPSWQRDVRRALGLRCGRKATREQTA